MLLPVLLSTAARPAGGAALEELAVSMAVAAVLAGGAFVLVRIRRHQRIAWVDRSAEVVGRAMKTPGWAALPLAVGGVSLIVAVFGFYWDVATHIDHGRDEGVFGNVAHWPILLGLLGIAFAGLLALLLGTEDERPGGLRLKTGWKVPIGGILLLVCGMIALAGFPIDDVWHRVFGQDVTLWSPPHIQMVAGASLATIALWVLHIEALRAREHPGGRRQHWNEVALAGAVLIGMSTMQGEFDFGVPQFNQLFHPVLIAVAAGIALVPARIRLGPGGALKAVAFFLLLRGLLTLFVTGLFEHLPFHFPLYLGAALAVEFAARLVPVGRQLTFGAVAGLGIGTLGLAVEAGWTHVWSAFPWTTALLPEAVLVGVPAAVAAGVVGGFLGRALVVPGAARQEVPAALAPVAGALVVLAIAFPMPRADVDAVAHIELEPVAGSDGEYVHATVALDPPEAAEGARWFHALSWQGAERGSPDYSRAQDLEPLGDGVYRTAGPVPIHGEWKTMVRLHDGRALVAAPIFLPEDLGIPAEEVPAEPVMTRELVPDQEILLREARPAPAWVHGAAYLFMALIAAAWAAAFVWGTRRLRLAAG